jgi:hypothetical protein
VNHYEQKQEARRQRLEARAEQLRQVGQAKVDRAHKMAEAIPFGQPILIGHHSEKRDRNYRGRIEGGFRSGFADLKAAKEIEAKAAAVGSGGISSDDPEAVAKLKTELIRLEARQTAMVAMNKVVKAFYKHGVRDIQSGEAWDRYLCALKAHEPAISAGAVKKLLEPDFAGRIGFPDYAITNNGANIRRIKQRIELLQKQAQAQPKIIESPAPGIEEVYENVEANRLQIMFRGKPAPEMIRELKSHGFKWAPSVGVWQRQLNNAARYAAQRIVEKANA